jgi:hypothetical protein
MVGSSHWSGHLILVGSDTLITSLVDIVLVGIGLCVAGLKEGLLVGGVAIVRVG